MRRLSDIWLLVGRYKYFFVLVIIIAVVGVLDENSLMHRNQRKHKINELKEEIENYKEHYDKDTRALNGLTDRKSLEKFAREKYFMHRDGEDLFVVAE